MNNKRKQLIIGASVGLLAVFLTGCGGSDDSGSPAPGASTTKATAGGSGDTEGASTAPGTAGTMGGTSAPMSSGGMQAAQPGGVFSNTPGAAPAKPGDKVAAVPVPYKPRRDPFKVDWTIPPPPPNIFNEVQPLRVATYNVVTPPPPNTEVREVPTRRVAGIMSGDGVFAIIDNGGDNQEIVKPGAETADGYKVISINADSVKLQKKEGNIIRTQVVMLSDLSTNPSPNRMGGGMMGAMGGAMSGSMGSRPSGSMGKMGGPRPGRGGGGGAAGGE